jgi:hypothetical protein
LKANTKTKTINQVAKTIAMLGRILTPTKVPVLIVFKANTKTKMTSRIANNAELANTMVKPVKRLNQLLVKVALLENTKTKRGKHGATTIV